MSQTHIQETCCPTSTGNPLPVFVDTCHALGKIKRTHRRVIGDCVKYELGEVDLGSKCLTVLGKDFRVNIAMSSKEFELDSDKKWQGYMAHIVTFRDGKEHCVIKVPMCSKTYIAKLGVLSEEREVVARIGNQLWDFFIVSEWLNLKNRITLMSADRDFRVYVPNEVSKRIVLHVVRDPQRGYWENTVTYTRKS